MKPLSIANNSGHFEHFATIAPAGSTVGGSGRHRAGAVSAHPGGSGRHRAGAVSAHPGRTMAMLELIKRLGKKVVGVLSCFDRIILSGTIPEIRYAAGMEKVLRRNGFRIFDFVKWAKPFNEKIRENAERLAKENGLKIQHLRIRKNRKDEMVKKIIKKRGDHPGLVHIFSVMETCRTYKSWYDKAKGEPLLKPDKGYCLHYYFYFIDEQLGLCHMRVPTWAPFRLQFYFNGHNLLANQLRKSGIEFTKVENVFLNIADFKRAQVKADRFPVRTLKRLLSRYTRQFCPVARYFPYDWGIMQAERATDIVFLRQTELKPFYERLVRTAIHAVKAENVATFLGRKLTANFQDELGNKFHTRIEGSRILHHMGPVSIKMYDKLGIVLRIETTVNDVSFFKHYRKVEHRDGTSEMKFAPMKKTMFSLPALQELTTASNRRYLDFLSTLDDPSSGYHALEQISRRVRNGARSYRGFNLFDGEDLDLFEAIVRGEFMISGFRNRDLRSVLQGKNAGQVGRMLKRLRTHKLIKRVGKTYKYYLTKLGRRVIAAALIVRELELVPALAEAY